MSADVLVDPVFRPSGEVGLRLYLPELSPANTEDAHNAVLRALDLGLGERRFAQTIAATWVHPITDAPERAFSLPEIDDYITRRLGE